MNLYNHYNQFHPKLILESPLKQPYNIFFSLINITMDLFKSKKQAKISQRWSFKKINISRTKAHITNL